MHRFVDIHHLEHVHFVGFKSKSELTDGYHAADLFVMPTREDIWGLVINEAMSYGLPVVSTDRCGAALELVEDGIDGVIVPAEDSNALAHGIISALNNLPMKSQVRDKIKHHTIENMVVKHVRLFQEREDRQERRHSDKAEVKSNEPG